MKFLIPIACLAGVFIGCSKEPASDFPAAVRVAVKTAVIHTGQIEETVAATGATILRREAQLRSPISGILAEFKFFNGDKLNVGEIVARVRTKESQASLAGAEELVRSAKTDKQREESRKALTLAQAAANTIYIRAPFDGILSSKSKSEMEVISEGDQIATLIDPSSIIFLADVPSSSLRRIRRGQHVQIRFGTKPGKVFHGIVHRIEPLVNPNDQTARVQVAFSPSDPDLEGSLFGEATIVTGKRPNVLVVPVSALLKDDENNTASIMIVGTDSIAYKVIVTAGIKQDSVVEVSSPIISAGNFVIVQGHYGLSDSTKVQVLH